MRKTLSISRLISMIFIGTVIQQVGKQEYDLILNPDVNSYGRQQWFYFRISGEGVCPSNTYTFNIINLEKQRTLFNQGLIANRSSIDAILSTLYLFTWTKISLCLQSIFNLGLRHATRDILCETLLGVRPSSLGAQWHVYLLLPQRLPKNCCRSILLEPFIHVEFVN